MARSMASIVACSSTNLARASTVFSRSNGAAMIFAKARRSSTKRSRAFFKSVAYCSLMTASDASTVSRPQSHSPMHRMVFDALSTLLLMTWKTGFCLIKPLNGWSVQAYSFRIFHLVGIRAVRQNHRIIRVDAFEEAKLSHGETVSGKPKGQPLQEGRHPQPAGGQRH